MLEGKGHVIRLKPLLTRGLLTRWPFDPMRQDLARIKLRPVILYAAIRLGQRTE